MIGLNQIDYISIETYPYKDGSYESARLYKISLKSFWFSDLFSFVPISTLLHACCGEGIPCSCVILEDGPDQGCVELCFNILWATGKVHAKVSQTAVCLKRAAS